MPNKRQKGMVLISVATVVFLIVTNIFFVSFNTQDINENTISENIFKTKKQSVASYCGDLYCDYANGENPLNCPEDCYL